MIKKIIRNYNKYHVIKISKHLLLQYQNYTQKRKLINNKIIIILFIMKKGLKSVIQYLQDIKIIIRK